jgi:hypothetical protein
MESFYAIVLWWTLSLGMIMVNLLVIGVILALTGHDSWVKTEFVISSACIVLMAALISGACWCRHRRKRQCRRVTFNPIPIVTPYGSMSDTEV